MQGASTPVVASISTTPAVSQLQGWEDLPDELLHLVVALLCSFRELLAFAATCGSWRDAFTSYPYKSSFCSMCPPLLLQFKFDYSARAAHLSFSNSSDLCKLRPVKVIDPANQNATLRCQISQAALDDMMYLAGSSYGQLICYHGGHFSVVDVFTGAVVSSPRLPLRAHGYGHYYYGMLTAPLASPNSHLLVSSRSSLYDWSIRSNSWSELRISGLVLQQIVQCNGQFIAMDCFLSVYTLQLAPQLGLQKITTKRFWFDNITPYPFLVVCGDILMIIPYSAYRLDMSTEPAEWVEVKLDNRVFFGVGYVRSPVFSCMSPEQWGGRSSCLYYGNNYQPWTVTGLSDKGDHIFMHHKDWFRQLEAIWVYPSMFCADGW